MFKKYLITPLAIIMVITLSLTGCGGKTSSIINNEGSNTNAPVSKNSGGNQDKPSGSYKDFKTALTNFVGDYTKSKEGTDKTLNASEEEDKYGLEILPIYTSDLNLAFVPMYDALGILDSGNKVTGKLLLSGHDGFKEKDGDTIKFGSSHTYEEEAVGHKAGDKTSTIGSFDTSKNYMLLEETLESGGNTASRSVVELKRLSDGTFLMRSIYASQNSISCVTSSSNTKRYTAVVAKGEKNLNFDYSSIADEKDITPEEMAKNFTAQIIINVDGDNVNIEKK